MKNVKRVKIDLTAADNRVTVIDDDGEHVLDVDDSIESIVINGDNIEVNKKDTSSITIDSLAGVFSAFIIFGGLMAFGWLTVNSLWDHIARWIGS